jgi:hypothetical protein
MRCLKNGVFVVSGYYRNLAYTGGTKREGDAYVCDLCGARILIGFGKSMDVHGHPISHLDSAISLDKTLAPQNIPEKKQQL